MILQCWLTLLEKKKEIVLSLLGNYELFFLEDLTSTAIKVLYVNEEILHLSKRFSFDYKLLPNDALIAATCKHHGINKIATFDPDFKRVDFLEIITEE